MDNKTKRRQTERIRRRLAKAIEPLGFQRTKTTFWTRVQAHIVEFIHLHQFTSAPAFRVHLGIRVLNDTFRAAALNGLHSSDGWFGPNREYVFEFGVDKGSADACAEHLAKFCLEIGEPWFAQFRETTVLLQERNSPLAPPARERLQLALVGEADEECLRASRKLLGIS